MIYYLKYDIPTVCKHLVQQQLNSSGLDYSVLNTNEVDISHLTSTDSLDQLNVELTKMGIEIVISKKSVLVQKIKEAIMDLVNQDEKLILSKTSQYLADRLNQGYRYLAAVFAEATHTTIENYIIFQRIEKAKLLISAGALTFTEIAWKLNYSSVGHFSLQFKNTTGLTPSMFKRIIQAKKKQRTTSINRSQRKLVLH